MLDFWIHLFFLNKLLAQNPHTVFIHINAPGVMHFSKGGGGAIITDKKNQLSSPVAMGDNGHIQPSSRLPACMMAGELKIRN